jgi:hypothetical protein
MEVTRQEATKKALELSGVNKDELRKIIVSYYSKRDLASQVLNIQPIYYDESRLWWFWDKKRLCWEATDETTIMNLVSSLSTANTVKTKEKSEIP